jgi:hypothetical protein
MDENEEKAKKHLKTLLELFYKNKTFASKDYSEGLSKFVQNFGEHCMDCPYVHSLTHIAIVKPLTSMSVMDIKYVKWSPPVFESKEEDDVDLDNSNS